LFVCYIASLFHLFFLAFYHFSSFDRKDRVYKPICGSDGQTHSNIHVQVLLDVWTIINFV